MKTITQNLRNIARMANKEQWENGERWYQEAHVFCVDLATSTPLAGGVSVPQVVGVLAALSPQTSWSVNKKACIDFIKTGQTPGYTGYKANVKKAQRILDGEDIETVLGKGTRYGAKVRAFYDNILNPDTSEQVTVDTHAIRGAYDIADVPRNLIRAVFGSRLNVEIQNAYKTVAKEFNLRPCQLQAIVWLVVKDNL